MNEIVAFIGLGAMGAPMASNLLEAGYRLRVYNRSAQRAQPLGERGATVCATIAEAVRPARFVVSMVSDDEATRATLLGAEGVLANAAPGTIVVGSSSNTPSLAQALAKNARENALAYLDAPVSGSVAQARARELVFMVGGEASDLQAAGELLRAMGRMVVHVGASGAGATLKLVNNMLSGTMIAALAEAISVARHAGLDPEAVRQVLCEGAAGSRITRTKIPKMFAREYSAQFQLDLMDKDLRYFLELAQQVDRPAPIGALVRNQLHAARLAGLGRLDTCALVAHLDKEFRPESGATPEPAAARAG